MPLLELDGIRKDFGGLRALDDVSLSVPEGAIIGLIGPNGSGKSTLIDLVAGSSELSDGRVIFAGEDISDYRADQVFKAGIARGYQEPALFFQLTVLDNVLLPIKGQRGERPWYAPFWRCWQREERAHAEAAMEVLRQVQLLEHYDKLAADLSGGQMKLLEIARAFMGAPRLLLLDEPTAGVAPKLAYEIFQQIARLRGQAWHHLLDRRAPAGDPLRFRRLCLRPAPGQPAGGGPGRGDRQTCHRARGLFW